MVSNTTFLALFRHLLLKFRFHLLRTLLASHIFAIVIIYFITTVLPVNATHITLSVPLNTNVVGGIVSQKPLHLPVDLSFEDFFTRVCAHMELDPLNVNIGYKFSGDRKTDPAFRLATEEDLRGAMQRGIDKIRRARSREVIMEIFNLVMPLSFFFRSNY